MKKIALLIGGKSNEHEVSITSGLSVIKNINQNKYDITVIYIDKLGNWYEYIKDLSTFTVDNYLSNFNKINNIVENLKKYDIIFPLIHGKNGEDGTIQGFLDLFDIKYIGSKVLASAISYDKIYTKMLLNSANIKQANYLYLKYINKNYYYVDKNFYEEKINISNLDKLITDILSYPVFIKPCKSGSSIGISKVNNKHELKLALNKAIKHDNHLLIEETINGKEIECAILKDNNKVIASTPGEIINTTSFYDYQAKYQNNTKTIIPSSLDEKIIKKIKEIAIKAFNIIDAKDLSRIDFLVTDDNTIYLNEINTIPGFTNISMYPKLLIYDGLSYSKLIDKLISNS